MDKQDIIRLIKQVAEESGRPQSDVLLDVAREFGAMDDDGEDLPSAPDPEEDPWYQAGGGLS